MRLMLLALAACGHGTDPVGDDTPIDGMTADSGASGSDDRLYPLEVGRSWTYDVTSTYPSCPGGQRETRVLGAATMDGRPTLQVRSFCGLAGTTSVSGNRVEEYYDWGPTGWMRALDEPVVAGHTWTTTNGSATFTMSYSPAGTVNGYSDCWKVSQNVAYTSYWIYCRRIGLVRYEIVDLAGGTIRAELRAYSF
jgi:hypothetical protein